MELEYAGTFEEVLYNLHRQQEALAVKLKRAEKAKDKHKVKRIVYQLETTRRGLSRLSERSVVF